MVGARLEGQAILDRLAASVPGEIRRRLPPPCLLDMQAEPVEYVEGERLVMRFPVLERYQNPYGYMQGGFVLAALDNTIGPFSFLIAPPSVTTQVTINYVRPVTEAEKHLTCIATVLERTRKALYLTGASTHPGGGIMGASGRNAARVVLKDLSRRRV